MAAQTVFHENLSALTTAERGETEALELIAGAPRHRLRRRNPWYYWSALMRHRYLLRARLTILCTTFDTQVAYARQQACQHGSLLVSINRVFADYRRLSHSILTCSVDQIMMINQLCVTEHLDAGWCQTAFAKFSDHCDLDAEISARGKALRQSADYTLSLIDESPIFDPAIRPRFGDWGNPQPGTQGWVSQHQPQATLQLFDSKQEVEQFKAMRTRVDGHLVLLERESAMLTEEVSGVERKQQFAYAQRRLSAMRRRSHRLINCVVGDIHIINEWCMANYIECDDILHVYDAVHDECDVTTELKMRYEKIQHFRRYTGDVLNASPFLTVASSTKSASSSAQSSTRQRKKASKVRKTK